MNPMFERILNTTLKIVPSCYFCYYPIDTLTEDYVRVDTLESVSKGTPKDYAHKLCAAEQEAVDADDQRIEAWLESEEPTDDEDLAQ